jgi:hypothetical protein
MCRKLKVKITDRLTIKLKLGEVKKLDIPAGSYTLEARMDWTGANPFPLTIEEGETKKVHVDGPSALKALVFSFVPPFRIFTFREAANELEDNTRKATALKRKWLWPSIWICSICAGVLLACGQLYIADLFLPKSYVSLVHRVSAFVAGVEPMDMFFYYVPPGSYWCYRTVTLILFFFTGFLCVFLVGAAAMLLTRRSRQDDKED